MSCRRCVEQRPQQDSGAAVRLAAHCAQQRSLITSWLCPPPTLPSQAPPHTQQPCLRPLPRRRAWACSAAAVCVISGGTSVPPLSICSCQSALHFKLSLVAWGGRHSRLACYSPIMQHTPHLHHAGCRQVPGQAQGHQEGEEGEGPQRPQARSGLLHVLRR